MASRYHWVQGGINTTWVNAAPFSTVQTVSFPAGAELKKVLLKQNTIAGVQSAEGFNMIAPMLVDCSASFATGANTGKTVFSYTRALQNNICVLDDFFTHQRIYSNYFCAGDNELGLDMKCSWGKATEPAYTIRVGINIQGSGVPGLTYSSTGYVLFNVRFLYYL